MVKIEDLTWEDGLLVVWLVWVWMPKGYHDSKQGFFQLRSVSLTKGHANYAKNTAKNDHPSWKVLVEESRAEHLFGESFGNFDRQDGDEPPDGYEGVDLGEE